MAPVAGSASKWSNLLNAAAEKYRHRNIPQAEQLCRELLDRAPGDPSALTLLGEVAFQVGAFSAAHRYYEQALCAAPSLAVALAGQARVRAALDQIATEQRTEAPSRSRFLLIKAWGYGFWSDVDHVIGQLLLAEMTDRVPVVFWGVNSLFRSPEQDNAFEIYFEPVSNAALADLSHAALTFYPPKWTFENLQEENLAKWSGAHSRVAGIYLLNRKEDVAVSDFHTPLCELVPWLGPESQYAGAGPAEIYRRLFAKYFRLRPRIEGEIDAFWQMHMHGKRWVAVHVRGSDKVLEVPELEEHNRQYLRHIDRLLGDDPSLALFLMTDSAPILADYRKRYSGRLLCTDCTRVSGAVGVHKSGHHGSRIAQEVIVDTYLAARCDYFLGNGRSKVSTTIEHLKDWPRGSFVLIGENVLHERNLFLHDW